MTLATLIVSIYLVYKSFLEVDRIATLQARLALAKRYGAIGEEEGA